MARRLKAREALEDFLGKQAKGMSERTIADKGADSEEAKWSEDDWKNSIYDVLKEHGTEFDKDDWAEAFEDYEDEDTGADDTTTDTDTEAVEEDTSTDDTSTDDTATSTEDKDTSADTLDKGYDIDKYNVYIDESDDSTQRNIADTLANLRL